LGNQISLFSVRRLRLPLADSTLPFPLSKTFQPFGRRIRGQRKQERGARTDLKSFDIAGVMTPLELANRHGRAKIAEIFKQFSKK